MGKRIVAAALLLAALAALAGCAESDEMRAAKEAFSVESERIAMEADGLSAAIEEADAILLEEGKPLDEALIPELETAIAAGKAIVVERPSMPFGLEEIQSETGRLAAIEYASTTEAIASAQKAVQDSRAQRKLVTAPSEAFVLERLGKVGDVDGMVAVTEDNDPNGKLNKAGGYTAAVFFSSSLVDQGSVYGDSLMDKGTAAGGSIEVYASEEDAQKRNDYLSSFDGSILSNGAHRVLGTVVIRVSDELTASQQEALDKSIADALTALQ